jgi:rhomboid protease GluP
MYEVSHRMQTCFEKTRVRIIIVAGDIMRFEDRLKDYYKLHPITSILILISGAMFIIVFFSGGFSSENLKAWGGLEPHSVLVDKEYYRIIVAMFLHGGLFHFLMNSYVLYIIGGNMERILGPKKYLLLYMVSGIVASVLVVFLSEVGTVTIGASGAIYGIMGGLFMLTVLKKHWFRPETIKWIRNLIIINLVLTFLVPNISVYGHLGGLIAGLLVLKLIVPDEPFYLTQFDASRNTYYN